MPIRDPQPADLPLVLATLQATPARLAACAKPHSAARLAQKPGPQGWSPAEHLAHLRGCDLVWTETIYAMLAEDEPALPLFSPRDWAQRLKFAKRPFADLLAGLTARRVELLAVLTPLPLAAWSRGADINVNRHTIYSQAVRLGQHELVHCEQLESELK